jgi:dTDP-glucose 4,6-dehydratase
MRILIYGHKGWIGQQFVDILKNLSDVDYVLGMARVENYDALNNEVELVNPTHIVSFIGRTHGKIGDKVYSTIDYLEQKGKLLENVRDNLYAPMNLALLAQAKNIHYTYLGTGCIFKFDNDDCRPFGKEENGFTEDDIPNFFGSGYSTVKGFTDQLMHRFNKNVLNLRIRMPITDEENPRNFITKIVNYEKICSIPNSMTVLPELLPLALKLMREKHTGTLNLTNPGLISHNEMLAMYKELVDPDFEWKNFSIEEQNKILASERSNNYLDTSLLEKLCPEVKPIKESVRTIMKRYKKLNPSDKNNNLNEFPNSNDTILLVTGGYGFIGSNFVNNVMERFDKIKIINFDAMYYCAREENVYEKWRNSERYTFIKGNLCSFDLVRHIITSYQPTHIIHFAAQSHVQNSFEDSLKYTQDNILGTHTLLECLRVYGNHLKRIIHVSTDEVYGESMLDVDENHKTEQSVLCPTNPYAATKAGAELIAQSYNHSFGMPIIITRGNNVYGPNQYPEKVIPRFIQQLKNGEKVTIQGDGSCVRAFMYVSDTSDAFIKILENGKIGEIYNIGCDEGMEYSIMDVAKILIKDICQTEDYDKWITYIKDRPFNDQRYYISNQKLKDLGWSIKISFEEGIKSLNDV